jgi:hypothetical protein
MVQQPRRQHSGTLQRGLHMQRALLAGKNVCIAASRGSAIALFSGQQHVAQGVGAAV